MGTIANQFVGWNITEKFLFGKYLPAKRDFIDEIERKLRELNIEKS